MDSLGFNFLPVRLPPVVLDFTSPDANKVSNEQSADFLFSARSISDERRVRVLFESLLDQRVCLLCRRYSKLDKGEDDWGF